jgi:hypothetical protein
MGQERPERGPVLPDASAKNAFAKNESWVLASQVDQCFFITDPSKPSRVVVRRGKRSIIGMEGPANEQDLEKIERQSKDRRGIRQVLRQADCRRKKEDHPTY